MTPTPSGGCVRHLVRVAAFCLIAGLLSGCTLAGPRAISSGRLNYNDAIASTSSQQLLMALVRSRYGLETSLLSVSSITANLRITAGSAVELGFGDLNNYERNLVPFSAGATYEENPTISYVPVSGEEYLNQLTSPVSIGSLKRLSQTVVDSAPVYRMLVASLNGIRNPDFLFPGVAADPRFDEVVDILSGLGRRQRLHWVEDDAHTGRFSIAISPHGSDPEDRVEALQRLLGLTPAAGTEVLVLPVSLAVDGRAAGGIGITTRSVMRLSQVLAAAIELPEEDVRRSVVAPMPPAGPVGQALKIQHARKRPEHAAVRVPFRGGWYYIDERDQSTKSYFRLLSALWAVTIAESTKNQSAAPVLTVPVSR